MAISLLFLSTPPSLSTSLLEVLCLTPVESLCFPPRSPLFDSYLVSLLPVWKSFVRLLLSLLLAWKFFARLLLSLPHTWKFFSGLPLSPDFLLGNPSAACRDVPYFDCLVQPQH